MSAHRRVGAALMSIGLVGCANPTEYTLLGAGATGYFAQAPANEIEQIYYLGVFDPQEQVPPTIYRVTVRGQASALSQMKFGSGWVHASLIDSLQTRAAHDEHGDIVTSSSGDTKPGIETGRRLMLFGPEGFREAPKDHRLVIVMGSSPDKFFNAMDQSLQYVQKVNAKELDPAILRGLIGERERLKYDALRLKEIREVAQDIKAG